MLLGMVLGFGALTGTVAHAGSAQQKDTHAQAFDAATEAPHATPFSWAAFFERRSVTFENFPLQPVQAKAEQVAARIQPYIQDPIYVVQVSRKELSPLLAVTSAQGMCIVVLNTNPDGWAVWTRFIRDLSESQRMDMVEVAIAHEIGHCMEMQNARVGDADATPDSISALSGKTELYADLFAGAYARLHMGEKSVLPVERLISLRQSFAGSEPSHDTSGAMTRLWKKMLSSPVSEDGQTNPHKVLMGLF